MTDEEKFEQALVKIAGYPRGGIIVAGTPESDRDEMVGIARQALIQKHGQKGWHKLVYGENT